MATIKATNPDTIELELSLALLLFDGFTGSQQLMGQTTVTLANKPAIKPFVPFQKTPDAIFLFFGLPPSAYTFQIRSNASDPIGLPPYYQGTDAKITLPMPNARWPAFPDISLADPNKPLDDPGQPASYRTQRQAATVQPTTAYPFPAGTTLVRGTVYSGGTPLGGATVRRTGDNPCYLTAQDGEFALFFRDLKFSSVRMTLEATHPAHPPQQKDLTVLRATTTVAPDLSL